MLDVYVIYDHPRDYPNDYVARRFEMDKITNDVFTDPSLEIVRAWVRKRIWKTGMGAFRLSRAAIDDPCIIETWI